MKRPNIAAPRRRLLALGVVAALLGVVGLYWVRTPSSTPFTRGFALSRELGCAGCHDPSDAALRANPGSKEGGFLPFQPSAAILYYGATDEALAEWILDGSAGRTKSALPEHEQPVITMPAYRGRLSARDTVDLIAYVRGTTGLADPAPALARKGREVAARLGCFNCHTQFGRGQLENPGSFKGVIPSWDGADYSLICRDDEELREWILDGITQRFATNPLARFFLDRQAIQMPAYRDRIDEEEIAAIEAYIHWLRDDDREVRVSWTTPWKPRSLREEGERLFLAAGCATCHQSEAIENPNAPGGFVPELTDTAERLGLEEPSEAVAFLRWIEGGRTGPAPESDVPDMEYAEVEFEALCDVIRNGYDAGKQDPNLPPPPMQMPSWSHRVRDANLDLAHDPFEALAAFLITRQEWNEEQ